MDKKELVQKIVESAVARGGVFLEDSMLGNAIEGILDDYPVIGVGNLGDWDWWGSAHAYMGRFDESDGSVMSASINAYGEEWAGAGKIGIVAYAWTGSNSTDTDQIIGRALFNYEELRRLTLREFAEDKVDRIKTLPYEISGVLCDQFILANMLFGVVEYAPVTERDFSWEADGLCYSLTAKNQTSESEGIKVTLKVETITVTAEGSDVVVGSASFPSKQLWNVLLDD